MIERCHGGAVAKQEVAYEKKQTSNKKSKAAIAGKCAEFVHPGDSVFLDAGTTTCEIAKRICDIPDIIVVTNDLEIAQVIKKQQCESIYLWRYAAERNGQSVRQICYRDVKGLPV